MAKDPKGLALRGRALKAAVGAAETPGLGALMRSSFFKELGMAPLFEVDLKHETGRTALLPFVEGKAGEAGKTGKRAVDVKRGGDAS